MTMNKYLRIASQGFKCADNGGVRLDLEEMVGQSRVFEFNAETDTFPLYFGGAAPMAWARSNADSSDMRRRPARDSTHWTE